MSERRWTILVVDDEASQRELLGGFAARLGYRVCEAASGEEALAAIGDETPDLVLLDVRLPGISGSEPPCRSSRSTCPAPRIGFSDPAQMDTAITSGDLTSSSNMPRSCNSRNRPSRRCDWIPPTRAVMTERAC